jgi:hypothetical protein
MELSRDNTTIGLAAIINNINGGDNIALGFLAGRSVTSAGSAICFGATRDNLTTGALLRPTQHHQILRPNFFSNSAFEIWIMVGRPCGQQ